MHLQFQSLAYRNITHVHRTSGSKALENERLIYIYFYALGALHFLWVSKQVFSASYSRSQKKYLKMCRLDLHDHDLSLVILFQSFCQPFV